jgi:hypothetical protein
MRFHIFSSVRHQSIILVNQLDATLCSLIYSLLRFSLHVSGAFAPIIRSTIKL